MRGERERGYLDHIAESIQLIDHYVRDGRPAFFEHRLVQDAVLRRLEILADATAQLSAELKDRHREIRWREVYGFANIAAHAYLDIDLERVWEIVTDHLPALRTCGRRSSTDRTVRRSRGTRGLGGGGLRPAGR